MRFEDEYRTENQSKQLDELMIRNLASQMTEAAMGERKQRQFYFAESPPSKSQRLISAAGVAAAAAAIVLGVTFVLPKLKQEPPKEQPSDPGIISSTLPITTTTPQQEDISSLGDYPVYTLKKIVAESDAITIAKVDSVSYITEPTDDSDGQHAVYAEYTLNIVETIKGTLSNAQTIKLTYSRAAFDQFGAPDLIVNEQTSYLFFLCQQGEAREYTYQLTNPFQSCYSIRSQVAVLESAVSSSFALDVTLEDVKETVLLEEYGWSVDTTSRGFTPTLSKQLETADLVVRGSFANGERQRSGSGYSYQFYIRQWLQGSTSQDDRISIWISDDYLNKLPDFPEDKEYILFLKQYGSEDADSEVYIPIGSLYGIYVCGENGSAYSACQINYTPETPVFYEAELEEAILKANSNEQEENIAAMGSYMAAMQRKIQADALRAEYMAALDSDVRYSNVQALSDYINEIVLFHSELPVGTQFGGIAKEDDVLLEWLVQQAAGEIRREKERIAQSGEEIAFEGGTVDWLENALQYSVSPDITLPKDADYKTLTAYCSALEYTDGRFSLNVKNLSDDPREEGRFCAGALYYQVVNAYEYEGRIYAETYKYAVVGDGTVCDADVNTVMGSFDILPDGTVKLTTDTVVPSTDIFVLEADSDMEMGYRLVSRIE